MPAGFNKGQIEYIKTIANVNGHKTYKDTTVGSQNHTVTSGTAAVQDDHLKYAVWCLGDRPVTQPTGAIDANTNGVYDGTFTPIDVYHVQIESDQAAADNAQRVTPECFLESLNINMRHITNIDQTIDQQSHKEFRLVIFRHREKQHASPQLAENLSNPLYDMFHGAANYKYGPKGHRNKMDEEGNINYDAHTGYEVKYDRDAMMTDPINSEDYIVMKDCRYYLGREYGGKHIYEDRFHWNFEDPIVTDNDDISYVDSNKNYCWYIMLLGVNNDGTNAIDNLGYVRFACNTHVTSG